MQIVVQKFGGTSVQSVEHRKNVINHIQGALANHDKVIVVVSALGRKPDPYATDSLLDLVDYPEGSNSEREIDLLVSCGETISAVVLSSELQKQQISSVALTGAQAGFVTDDHFTDANILEVDPKRIMKEFETSDVVVVAGYQGQTTTGEITTIGRGGSDTSATSLGAAIQAKRVEIFTDVSGIMTADPRVVKSARKLDVVTYDEICNLAKQGAKVVHPRAVEIAKQANIPIRVRSTNSTKMGTLITESKTQPTGKDIPKRLITGIAHVESITQMKVKIIGDIQKQQSAVFKAMAEADIPVDFINISPSEVEYTIPDNLTNKAVTIVENLGHEYTIVKNCVKASAVGTGMTSVPDVASRVVQALTNKDVPILQSADSHATIWVLIKKTDLIPAANALHEEFGLSKVQLAPV